MAEKKTAFFEDYTSLGQILIRRGFLTKRQLARALKVQGEKLLGDIVVTLGYCTRDEVRVSMAEQRRSRFIPNGVDSKSEGAFERAALALKRIDDCVEEKPSPKDDSPRGVVKIDI
jgi:hypothetical protein